MKGVLAQTPEMPEPYLPVYEKWKEVFEQFKVDENTILIGHSCGGGFLVRWLSENKVKVGKVVLVAPWLDPNRELQNGFFDFDIDPDMPIRTRGLTVMYSTDDDKEMLVTADILKSKLHGADFKEYIDKGHFCKRNLGPDGRFQELLDVLFIK